MKLVSWNVNGIRACVNKGHFLEYLQSEEPDVIGIQEIKAMPDQLEERVLNPSGYYSIWHSAQKKGYSGVAIFTKQKPKMVLEGFGVDKFDNEGRAVIAEYDNFVFVNCYFPNGKRDEERLLYKLDFYKAIFDFCNDLRSRGKNIVIVGDYNTAHKEIDLARPKENEKVSGFLPIERQWLDKIIDEFGYVDTFRQFNQEPKQYTWWDQVTRARDRNVGWRIDYVFVNKEFMPKVKSAFIHQNIMGSDHCPVGITL